MELLQLSSISAGWISIGAIEHPTTWGAGEAAMFAALGAGLWAKAKYDPHWAEVCKPGHFDGPVDDDCARLMGKYLTPEARASLDAGEAADRREGLRRLLTSKNPFAIVARLQAQRELRREAAAV